MKHSTFVDTRSACILISYECVKFWISPKKLYSLIKNSRQDNQGISTVKDSENILHSENVKMTNLLKSQFKSVFMLFSTIMYSKHSHFFKKIYMKG